MNYELHPLCTLFPRMAGEAFESLVADIKANGLREPIVLHDGMILDGGNRYRACLEAGVSPTFVQFDGGSIVAFVLSANLHRRHMTPGQQAAIVAAAQDWAKAQPVGKPKSGSLAGLPKDGATEGPAVLPDIRLTTVADRAAQSGAGERTQRMADKVAKADPELVKQVAHGEVSLPAAVERITGKRPGAKAKPAPEPVEADELQDAIDALASDNDRLIDENKSLRMAASPDVLTEIERLKAYCRAVEQRRDQLMNENAQLKREIKALRRRLGE